MRSQVSCVYEATIEIRRKELYLWPKTATEAISECIILKFFMADHALVPLADASYAHTECAHVVPT